LALAGLWSPTRALLPTAAFLIAAAPIASVAIVLAVGRRDGMSADRLAAAFLRHTVANRRLVPAPEGVPPMPKGLPKTSLPGPLDFPVSEVGADGLVYLGDAARRW